MTDPNRDNVTPFRPRRPPPRRRGGGGLGMKSHRAKAIMAHALTLLSFALYFFLPAAPWSYLGLAVGVAAVAIAAGNRQEAMPWAQTHHEHALRTLIIGAAIWTVSSLIGLFGAAFYTPVFWIHVAVCVWAAARTVAGMGIAAFRKPMPNPRGPLI